MRKLLDKIQDNNIVLEIVDGQLKIFASSSEIDKDLIAEIREKKAELFELLLKNKASSLNTGNTKNDIPQLPSQSSYAVSSSQRRLWILSQLESGSTAYNLQGTYLFEGSLDKDALRYSLEYLIDRHEVLRTVFKEVAGEVRQYIQPAAACGFVMEEEDLRSEAQPDAVIGSRLSAMARTPFDLSRGPLVRVNLLQRSEGTWVFSYVMHHIISDGWSMSILMRELLMVYNARVKGVLAELRPLRIQYKDYAGWQQQQLSGEVFRQHEQYWLGQLGGEVPVLKLVGDNDRPRIKSYNGSSVKKVLPAQLCQGLRQLSQQQGGTLFMGLLAAIKALLYRYTGQEDIIAGTSMASREHVDLEDQIGFYVNTLALRTRFKGSDSYEELLKRVKEVTVGAYEHQVYPFDELVDKLELERDTSRSVLFDVMVVLQSAVNIQGAETAELGGIRARSYEQGGGVMSKYDCTFFFQELRSGELHLNIDYNKDIYSDKRMKRLLDHLERLMNAVITDPDVLIKEVNYLSEEEKEILLVGFNETQTDYDSDHTLLDLFELQVQRTPDNIALVCEGRSLSYRELNSRANEVAAYLLRECRVSAGDIVGIMLERSERMLIALVGILKAGCAYVALEADMPAVRKEYIMGDSKLKVLITETEHIFDLTYYNGRVMAIDVELESGSYDQANPEVKISGEDLAYVVYTFGSTGEPKGVMIRHHSVVDYYYGLRASTNIGRCKSYGLVSTLAADLGNTVIYGALLSGASLHVYTRAEVMKGRSVFNGQVDCVKIVPSHWRALQDGDHLLVPNKCLVFGGEQLGSDIISYIRERGGSCEVYNHYGPSETTIGKLVKRIAVDDKEERISIGKPFGHTWVYIKDEENNLLPIGVPGEICIGGAGVARGYLNRPELTTERFVTNPFRRGELMYLTGDTGRWLEDGNVEFVGRKDDQVKIRGYRIEPGEIASVLNKYEGVEKCVVQARDNQQAEKELVAYIVSAGTIDESELRSYASRHLPAYMLPVHYVTLEELPLTPNGKIDRKRLPQVQTDASFNVPLIVPATETEKKLTKIWEEVLGKTNISVQSSFFYLGGNSLKIVRMANIVNKEFNTDLAIDKFFEYITIKDIGNLLDTQNDNTQSTIVTMNETEILNF